MENYENLLDFEDDELIDELELRGYLVKNKNEEENISLDQILESIQKKYNVEIIKTGIDKSSIIVNELSTILIIKGE